MSNIATGIGLSGALESDASGQDSRVEAAKFGAMTRLAKKKEEEEQKKSLEKEVRKNIIVDNKLDNEFYQDQFSDRVASEISEIIGGYSSGEMTEAEVWNRVQGFKNFSSKIHSADKDLTSSKAKIEKDPFNYDWRDTKTVGGKDVNSFFEAVNNNPLARTEEGFNELQELYPGAEYSFIKSTPEDIKRGAPEFVVKYDPMPMLDPKDIVAEIAKDQKRFTTPFIGEAMPVKDEKGFDKWIAPVGTKMNEAVLEEAVNNALEDPQMVFGLQRYYEAQLRKEYKKNNPDKSERDFMDSDWQNEIPKLLERDLVNPLREMVANQGYREVTKTKPTVAPSSGSVFESKKVAVYEGEDVIKAQSSQPWEVQSETGKKYQYLAVAPIQPKTGSVAMNIDIRPGTLYWDKKENALRTPKDYESTERVIPHEMVVMSDGAKSQPYIRYLLAVPPQSGGSEEEMLQSLLGQQSSQDRFKTKSYESFYVPASEENLKRLAGATDTGIDEWNKLKISLTKKATSGRQSASSGGAFINQGGGVAPQQNPVSGSSNTDKYAKYGATKR